MSGVLVERDGPVTRLTLDHPEKANALDDALVEALLTALGAAEHDGTRLLVFHPGVKNFSAGFDFSGAETSTEGELLRRFVRLRAATVVDTRASDMADLVASVTAPGLKARIAAYRSGG